MKVKREERGWAGHFFLAHRCLFRRNTLVAKDDRRIVVSTVGALPNNNGMDYEEIGYRRYYETMAFEAQLVDNLYWDADVQRIIPLESNTAIRIMAANSDMLANEMHEQAVREVMQILEAA